jgi:hypothetical protein
MGMYVRRCVGPARQGLCVSNDVTIGRNNTSLILHVRGVLEKCCLRACIRCRPAWTRETDVFRIDIMTNPKVNIAINTSAFVCSSALVGISIAAIYLASDAYNVFTNRFPSGSYGWELSHW